MNHLVLFLAFLVASPQILAAEPVSGTNSYVLKEEHWHMRYLIYWEQENFGTFTVSLSPIEPGFVECRGAGFGRPSGVKGEGICIFENDEGTFTWTWQATPGEMNSWQVSDGTGKYEGMTGSGTARSRIQSEFTALQQRVTDWKGEIEFRK